MMKNESRTILVVNDVEATRAGIKEMLERDGYRVLTARDEPDAAEKRVCLKQIDLMLVSLNGKIGEITVVAERIRRFVGAGENVPIVIFCADEAEADESAAERNIYLSCPDDFNQLRKFIGRLLARFQGAAQV